VADVVLDSLRRHRIPCAVLSDTLDSLGYREQAMRLHIRPLDLSLDMVGRASAA
jgi:hypothetical protein